MSMSEEEEQEILREGSRSVFRILADDASANARFLQHAIDETVMAGLLNTNQGPTEDQQDRLEDALQAAATSGQMLGGWWQELYKLNQERSEGPSDNITELLDVGQDASVHIVKALKVIQKNAPRIGKKKLKRKDTDRIADAAAHLVVARDFLNGLAAYYSQL